MGALLAQTERAEYVLVQAALPGRPVENIGVILVDAAADQAHCRFRRDWDELFADPEDVDYFRAAAEQIELHAGDMGAARLLAWMEADFSNSLRVSERDTALVENWGRALARLHAKHVAPSVLPYRTHLPLYNVYAAAGGWGENRGSGEDRRDWIEMPPEVRIDPDMFVAEVVGRSMEPRIHDGDLCLFRGGPALAGTRQGALVLVENTEDVGQRFTIKRYRSEKIDIEDGYRHTRITLEPLNPDFEAWDLDPDQQDRLHIRGIFVQVLDSSGS